MKLAKNISIVVITHNRSKFIARMVYSLNAMDYGGCLIIADSSSPQLFGETKIRLAEIPVGFVVKHLHIPKSTGMSISQSMNASFEEGVRNIQSKYAMLTCDDDIPIPTTLESFEKFLDTNSQYNGVNGELAWYDLNSHVMRSRVLGFLGIHGSVRCNPTYEVDGETASQRLDGYLDNFFHTMFSIVRVETYENIFPENTNEISFPHFCADYNWMFGIALTGKIKHFKEPQVIRQMHGNNLGIKGPSHPFPSYLESLIDSNWGRDANMFVNNLASLIGRVDGLSIEESLAIAMDGFRRLTVLRLSKPKKGPFYKRIFDRLLLEMNLVQYRFSLFGKYKLYKNAVSLIDKYKVEV